MNVVSGAHVQVLLQSVHLALNCCFMGYVLVQVSRVESDHTPKRAARFSLADRMNSVSCFAYNKPIGGKTEFTVILVFIFMTDGEVEPLVIYSGAIHKISLCFCPLYY